MRARRTGQWTSDFLPERTCVSCLASTPTSAVLVELRPTSTFSFLRNPLRLLCLLSKRPLLNPELPISRLLAIRPFSNSLGHSFDSLLSLPSLLLTFRGSKLRHFSILSGTVDQLVSKLSAVVTSSLPSWSILGFLLALAFVCCPVSHLSCHLLVSISESLFIKLLTRVSWCKW